MTATVVILGADGYIGWPMAMHLSRSGYKVIAIDSLARRRWDIEGGTYSLVPIAPFEKRVQRWRDLTGRSIECHRLDLCDHAALDSLIRAYKPSAVVHLAEQRSAPFSMIDREHAVRTQVNNTVGNLNLLFAIKAHSPECQLVKLGTMGEYGCPNIDIEEGYITIHHNGRSDTLPYPKLPPSFYHLSKVSDSQNIHFATRTWGLRATDLNQGVVYGNLTDDTALHPDLMTRLDFDTIWGTALNRFCVQAAVGVPLTVYGKGGQTRGYLNIRDTMACITLAIEHPAERGECRVFNQFTEQFTINQLAELVAAARADRGLETTIDHLPNPRVEHEDHYYNARNSGLLDLGLKPHYLGSTLVESMIDLVEKHVDLIDPVLLQQPSVDWRSGGNEVWAKYANQAMDGASANGMRDVIERATAGPVNIES
jgi:UDP-sulfoquinovose synthase